MANRYWVGGAGTWNTTSTTNWSTSSGGTGGASVPTAADSVFFDQAGTYTVTMTGALTCLDITVSAGTVTFATGTSPTLAISGSMSLVAGTLWSTTAAITFNATTTGKTITTNGTTMGGSVTFNGAGGGWTLGSALSCSGILTVAQGTFDTSSSGNYAVTAVGISITATNTRTVNFNASTITSSRASALAFDATTITGLTFNAGTSQINLSGATSGISSGGLTFNNVSFTSAAASAITITGANTFNTLSFAGRTSIGITPVTFSANQTITTLTLNAGTAAQYRTFLASNAIGTQITLSVGTLTAGAADYDFRDIAVTGAASPIAPTRAGDCKGNSGITFPAAKTVYWQNTNLGGNWSTSAWALSIGGASAAANFPLAQDTAAIPSNNPNSGSTITINANYNIGTIDMSARTSNTMTLATGTTTPAIYGNWINGTGTTISGTGQMIFAGRGSQTITSAGKTFTQPIAPNTPGGSVTLADAFASSASGVRGINLIAGTFSDGGYNASFTSTVSSSGFQALGGTLNLNGQWTIAGTGTAWNVTSSSLIVSGSGTISMTGPGAKTFAGGSIQTYPTLNQGGAGALTIQGSNGFANITNTYSATGATTIIFTSGTTQTVTNFTAAGTSGKVLTIQSSSAGSAATLSKASGTVSVDYLSVKDSVATGGASWYAGANSTNVSGNTGWVFTAPPSGYTLTASQGSYAVTGQSLTLLRSKQLTASQGSYAVTGQSASIDKGRWLSALNGVYSVSGQNADIVFTSSTGATQRFVWLRTFTDRRRF
jgi:hypothetical protein